MKIELKSCNRNQSKHRQCSKDLEAKKRLDLKKKDTNKNPNQELKTDEVIQEHQEYHKKLLQAWDAFTTEEKRQNK